MYMEPQDECTMTNVTENITAHIQYHERAWTSNYYTKRVDCMIKDPEGNDKIQIEGYYTSEVIARDLETERKWVIFQKPEYNGCNDPHNNCNFNGWSLKLN